ncbi:MAG: hypothetical protein LBP85_10300 [Prevotellaceae bacterium]|jgi:hypothetical protein|nr:hypothetical protein [Prevotellaceae bacterium]
MKTKILQTAALLLILAGMLACGKEEKNTQGNVPYRPCDCDDKPLANLDFPSGEAYLFNDSIPNDMDFQIRDELNQGHIVNWIVYDSETDKTSLTVGEGSIRNICEICNYPDFAKAWSIPQNGYKVYFEGITYEPCIPKGGIATISYYDYILTVLKRK